MMVPPWIHWPGEPQAFAIASGLATKTPPETRKQMLSYPDMNQWLNAEQIELEALRKKDTFGEILPESKMPKGTKAIGTRYVYTYRMKDGVESHIKRD